MDDLWKVLRNLVRDPRVSTTLVLVAGVMAGFALLGVALASVTGRDLVPFQAPWLVSAGLGGLGLIGTCLSLLTVHLSRVEAAEERRLLSELQREALRLQNERLRNNA